MNHELIQQKLLALYDSPLTEEERKLVEGHLSQCQACRRAVAEWKIVSRNLFTSSTFSEAAEDLFVAKVMDRVRSSALEKAPLLWKTLLRWVVPVAGSAVVAAWVFFSILPNPAPSTSSNSVASAFTYDSSYAAPSGSGFMQVSYASNDIAP